MYRKMLTALVLFLALTLGSISAVRAAGAPGPAEANPWSVLLEDGAAASVVPNAQTGTNLASIVLALVAAGAAAAALLWCREMTDRLTCVSAGILTAREKQAVAEATAEYEGLSARLDELGHMVDARLSAVETGVGKLESQLGRIDSDTRQLESRTIEIEQACRLVKPMAQDLARLSQFRSRVEQIHSGIVQAFNGSLSRGRSASESAPESPAGRGAN
jgi:hypothetical protein